MEPKINYLALLLLIILGVAVGNLASSFITSNYFTKQHSEDTKVTPKLLPETSSQLPAQAIQPKETQEQLSVKEPDKRETTRETVRETVKLSPDGHKEAETVKQPTDSKQLIEARKLDENGLRLAKRCNEWTTVHKDMNTPSSERGMTKHCSEYYDYLSFGVLPEST